MLRCWDTGANCEESEGKEAQQLGSLSRDWGSDKGIGEWATSRSLWRQLLSSVKDPLRGDLVRYRGKWTATGGGIQYQRELAMVEVVHSNLDNSRESKDPDEVQHMQTMRQNFVQSTHVHHHPGYNEVGTQQSTSSG